MEKHNEREGIKGKNGGNEVRILRISLIKFNESIICHLFLSRNSKTRRHNHIHLLDKYL